MTETIVLLILSIILSGFFSGAEVAILALTELKARHLVERGVKNAKSLLYLKTHPSKTLITILIGNNIVNIGGSALATKLAIDLFADAGVGIATGVMTFVILTFGEILPKTFSNKHAKTIALTISPVILFLMRALYPFVWLFFTMSKGAHKLIKTDGTEPLITEQEVRDIVKLGEEVGQIKTDEMEMIHRVFRFDDTSIDDVMTPRTDMFALDMSMPIKDALPLIVQNDFSRIPVYEEQLDRIKGIIFARHLLEVVAQGHMNKKLSDIMEQPLFVPAGKKIDKFLKELQRKKTHLAIVVDEYGGVEGLITIEDILEELVGEIFDESDEVENLITPRGDHQWLILGKTQISDINEELDLSIPEHDDFNTIAGLIQSTLGRVPIAGEECILKRHAIRLTVKKVEGPVILEVVLKKI